MLTEAAQAVDDAAKKAAYDKLDALYRKEVPSCPLMYRPDEFYELRREQLLQLAGREQRLRPADAARRGQHLVVQDPEDRRLSLGSVKGVVGPWVCVDT